MISKLDFKQRWLQGWLVEELAEVYGVSEAEVERFAQQLGLMTRVSASEHADIEPDVVAFCLSGDWTLTELTGHFGVSSNVIRKILQAHDIDPSQNQASKTVPKYRRRRERMQAMAQEARR